MSAVEDGNIHSILFFIVLFLLLIFLIMLLLLYKFCPSILEAVSLRASACYLRDFSVINVCSSSKNYPLPRRTSDAHVVCIGVEVFRTKRVHLIIFYSGTFLLIKTLSSV
jgi:uncharacterized membrane protein